jgi:Domain of unknown function (DUF4145)
MSADLERMPTSLSPVGSCPRCGRHAHFTKIADHALSLDESGNAIEQVVILRCAACNTSVVSIEYCNKHADEGDEWLGQHWWPMTGLATFGDGVPEPITSTFEEGIRAMAINAPRAAAVMFRATLAEIIEHKGSAAARSKDSLYEKLKQMSNDGTLHPSISEWAAEIRLLGNVGAHPEAQNAITNSESRELAQLTRQLIEFMYEIPAKIARARSGRMSSRNID